MAPVYFETGRHLIAASISLAVVDVIAVLTKFWVRLSLKQPLMADDWLLVPATVRTHPLLFAQTMARPHRIA